MMTGAEETDAEVLISEVAPHPDPGWQYVGWAGRVLQVHDDGGGSRATMTEASSGVDDACTSLSDANVQRQGKLGSGGSAQFVLAHLQLVLACSKKLL